MSLSPFFQGFGISAGLIIAIGAQNAHVLTLGIKRHYPLSVAFICSLCDAILILAGVIGMGLLLEQFPAITRWAAYGGALFLAIYGLRALLSALKTKTLTIGDNAVQPSFRMIIISTLMVTLINPHVYLDTMVLIGTVSGQYAGDAKVVFAVGAILASFSWFFTLSWGAGKLRPLFQSTTAWRVLDLLVGVTMLTLSVLLVRSV